MSPLLEEMLSLTYELSKAGLIDDSSPYVVSDDEYEVLRKMIGENQHHTVCLNGRSVLCQPFEASW